MEVTHEYSTPCPLDYPHSGHLADCNQYSNLHSSPDSTICFSRMAGREENSTEGNVGPYYFLKQVELKLNGNSNTQFVCQIWGHNSSGRTLRLFVRAQTEGRAAIQEDKGVIFPRCSGLTGERNLQSTMYITFMHKYASSVCRHWWIQHTVHMLGSFLVLTNMSSITKLKIN